MEPTTENLSSEDSLLKSVVETILFISDRPITLEQIKDVIEGVSIAEIRETIELLKAEYDQRRSAMTIVEIAGGYQMLTRPDFALYVKRFYRTRHKERLSKPALETLAIIAYKQPAARMDIELIRGVNSDGVIDHLLEKGLVKIAGRKEVPGRPFLYTTTKEFLEYFGLRSLSDLPKLENFAALQEMDADVPQEAIPASVDSQAANFRGQEESISPNVPKTSRPQMPDQSVTTAEPVSPTSADAPEARA